MNDICNVTGLEKVVVQNILNHSNLSSEKNNNEYVEENFFLNQNFRKIKKSLIFDVAKARIEELAEITLTKNTNVKSFLKKSFIIFLNINDNLYSSCFKDDFKFFFQTKINLN